jgi:hypothetical protein
VGTLAVNVMLSTVSVYAFLFLFFRLLNWADTEPPRVAPVSGLCGCSVDPMAGVYGHCGHKRAEALTVEIYRPKHALGYAT